MSLASKKRKADENGAVLSAAVSPPRLTLEDALKILEPLSSEDLRSIVSSAMVTDTPVISSVRAIADRDYNKRRLFIRGLGWETTTYDLRYLFSTFGELAEAVVMRDQQTGKPKGYGFITFKHVDGALLALKEPSKVIDGRVTVTQLSADGKTGGGAPTADVALRKIYVRNVPPEMPSARLLAHFSSYGEIEVGPLGIDKVTGKLKSHALFIYKSAEAAQAAIEEPKKLIDGHQLTCKLAIESKKGKLGDPAIPVPAGFYAEPGDAPASPTGSMHHQLQSSYLGYSGNMGFPECQGRPHLNSSLQSSVGVGPAGLSSMGSQVPASLSGPGVGGPGVGCAGRFGGPGAGYASGFSGPGAGYAGGLGGPGAEYAGGLGGSYGSSSQYSGQASAGGYGGLGMDSGFYNRMPPSLVGMGAMLGSGAFPESGRGYAEGGPYLMSSLGNSGHQKTGSPPGSMMMPPSGIMYRVGMPPYY